MKKIMVLIVVLLFSSLLLVGCGGGNAPLGGVLEGEWRSANARNPYPCLTISGYSWNGVGEGRCGQRRMDAAYGDEVSIQIGNHRRTSGPGRLGGISLGNTPSRTVTGWVTLPQYSMEGNIAAFHLSGTFSVNDGRVEFLLDDGTVWFVNDIQYTANTLDIGRYRFYRQ